MASQLTSLPIENLRSVDSFDCQYAEDVIEITGVVSPSSQGGWPHRDGYEVFAFEFSAWRGLDGVLIDQPLVILRPVEKVANAFGDFHEASIHRIQVLWILICGSIKQGFTDSDIAG